MSRPLTVEEELAREEEADRRRRCTPDTWTLSDYDSLLVVDGVSFSLAFIPPPFKDVIRNALREALAKRGV